MPLGLRRIYGQHHLHFITCSCYRRLPGLADPSHRTAFVRQLDKLRTRYAFALIGYVVMPEHIHLLISEPEVGNSSLVMQVLKQTVSRQILQKLRRAPQVQQSSSDHRLLVQLQLPSRMAKGYV